MSLMSNCSFPTMLMNSLLSYNKILITIWTCFLALYLYSTKSGQKKVRPTNWPIIGMLPSFLANIHRMHEYVFEVLRDSKWTFSAKGPWFMGRDFVMSCDPANVNHVMNINAANYNKAQEYVEMYDVYGNSLFHTDGELWKTQRKLSHALFYDQNFKTFSLKSSRNNVEEGLIPLLHKMRKENKVVNLKDVFLRLSFDNICGMIGEHPRFLASDHFPEMEISKAIDDAQDVIFGRHLVPSIWWKTMRLLNLGDERRIYNANKVMKEFEKNMGANIQEIVHKADNDVNNEVRVSYISPMLKGEERTNLKDYLKNSLSIFILAGRDSTACSLTWFFWLLSKHPHVEGKIVQELKANWPKDRPNTSTPFTHEELTKLVYLHATLLECLRLYPPFMPQQKTAMGEDTLPSGLKVKPGTVILFHLYSMGRIEDLYGKDYLEFKPERWLNENWEIKHMPTYKFFAFGSGPRACLGKDMAINNMKTTVAAMLSNFKINILEDNVVDIKLSLVLHMKNGLMATISKREDW